MLDSASPQTVGPGNGNLVPSQDALRKAVRQGRACWAIWAERALEGLIRLSGVSAILFVLAIFYFVFQTAAPALWSKEFHLWEFLFSTQWYPTSMTNVRYGVGAMIVGTFSVTVLAMVIAVPFGLGAPFMSPLSVRVPISPGQTVHGPLLSPLRHLHPNPRHYATAVMLLGTVLLVNALSIALRVYMRSRKKW